MNRRQGPPGRAKRSLGQNFLVDENVCRRIVDAVDPRAGETVIEIGPGRGALTRHLAESEARLVALEKDHQLAAELSAAYPGVEVMDADALEHPWERVDAPTLKICGNLPYNVASRIIWDVAQRLRLFSGAVFMVQHEVGLRLCAESSTKAYGALSAWVQAFMQVEYLFKVGPGVFRPRPKVDSAVLRLGPRPAHARPAHPEALSWLLKTCFQKRRKQLGTILKDMLRPQVSQWFEDSGVPLAARPETLSPEQFSALSEVFAGVFMEIQATPY